MSTRRRFITESLVALGTLSMRVPRLTARTVRIGTCTLLEAGDLEAGLAFGTAEADRSASLFGWNVRRIRLRAADLSAGSSTFDALIVGGGVTAVPAHVPVLRASCDDIPRGANLFTVAPCDPPTAAGDDPSRRIVAWHRSLVRFGAEQLNDRYRGATGRPMTGESWLGWFTMKLLAESALRANSSDPRDLMNYLRSPAAAFDGHKGEPLRFDARGRLRQPLYVVTRSARGDWVVDRTISPPPALP